MRYPLLAVVVLSSTACAASAPRRPDAAALACAESPFAARVAAQPADAAANPGITESRTLFATQLIGERAAPMRDTAVYRASRPGRTIDLDLKGADFANVCRLLADVGRVNVVVGDDVRGTVTVRMKRVPWDRALDAIVRTKGFRAERDGDMIVVLNKMGSAAGMP